MKPITNLLPLLLGTLFLTSLMTLGGCESETPPVESPPSERDPTRIGPWAENPFYWEYKRGPILLLGGSDEDNLFNHPDIGDAGLEAHLDLLVSVGGNYVRNTMSSRDEGNLWPFQPLENGLYDLNAWNDEYWDRFENLLRMTNDRDIIVQLEVWDRFDFSRDPWQENPFNPRNNVNYSSEASGLPEVIESHPGERESPFFRSTPDQEDNNPLLLQYQRAFVDKMLSISLPYPNVLYTISNETNESEIWSAYWADFIRERATEGSYEVHVTEMWDPWDLDDPMHKHTIDDPNRYTFVDISQNNHQRGQKHWDNAQEVRRDLMERPRPINSVKIYGGTRHGGGFEEGTRKLWRNVFGGLASSRFHRPSNPQDPSGIGLNELAQSHIRSMRMLTDELYIFTSEPQNKLLSNRDDDEAYLIAERGRQYAVYFPAGGSVELDLTDASGLFTVRWLNILSSQWEEQTTVEAGGTLVLDVPGVGPWAVLLTAETGV